MSKLLRERAATWARKLIASTHTVRNWTHEDAARFLQQAWLAGASSERNRLRDRRPVGLAMGTDGHGIPCVTISRDPKTGRETVVSHKGDNSVLVIPALKAAEFTLPRAHSDIKCLACDWACNSAGKCSNLGCPGLGGGDA